MKVGKWHRLRSNRELEEAEFCDRARRLLNFNNPSHDTIIVAEVSRIYDPGENGWEAGWAYLICNFNADGMRRGMNIHSDPFETRELAMFMADLKLIDLGFDIENPFELLNE